MGRVLAVFRLLPEEPGDFETLKNAVERLNPKSVEEEPIAFGLKAIKATFVIPEEEGKMPELEEKLAKLPKVKGVESLSVSRMI